MKTKLTIEEMENSGRFTREEIAEAKKDLNQVTRQFHELLSLVPTSWRRWIRDYARVKTEIRNSLERGNYLPQ